MIIKKIDDIKSFDVEGVPGVSKKIGIGPDDGSEEIIMRIFSVEPGKSTPYHTHGFPHLVKVEKGSGLYVDSEKNEHPLSPGSLVYVPDEELHCFRNSGDDVFEFICIVPHRGEK